MKISKLILFAALFCLGADAMAQQARTAAPAKKYSIIIKGGHVIDPKNNIDAIMDVAIEPSTSPLAAAPAGEGAPANGRANLIRGGRIALVAKNIDPSLATRVVDAKGCYVTPGLIDIHSHNFWGTEGGSYMNGPNALPPDGFTFRNGVTTVVDAGSPGWRTFPLYKKQTIARSKTRVLVFLNIVGEGMRGGRYEQDTLDMDPEASAKVALANKADIVGFKLAHYSSHSWTPTDRAVRAGQLAGGLPLMVDFGEARPALSLEELFMKHLRPGDIFTHCFGQLNPVRESIIDTITKKPFPYVLEARKKGIIFDVGYGGISFAYTQAIPAIKAGFYPNSISTDIHTGSYNMAMKDMLTTMSKFLAMGMPLKDVITASSWNPAKEIKREELGNLSVGSEADVAVLSIRTGTFGLFDYTGRKLTTSRKLECEVTIRNGSVVYDLNGRTNPIVGRN